MIYTVLFALIYSVFDYSQDDNPITKNSKLIILVFSGLVFIYKIYNIKELFLNPKFLLYYIINSTMKTVDENSLYNSYQKYISRLEFNPNERIPFYLGCNSGLIEKCYLDNVILLKNNNNNNKIDKFLNVFTFCNVADDSNLFRRMCSELNIFLTNYDFIIRNLFYNCNLTCDLNNNNYEEEEKFFINAMLNHVGNNIEYSESLSKLFILFINKMLSTNITNLYFSVGEYEIYRKYQTYYIKISNDLYFIEMSESLRFINFEKFCLCIYLNRNSKLLSFSIVNLRFADLCNYISLSNSDLVTNVYLESGIGVWHRLTIYELIVQLSLIKGTTNTNTDQIEICVEELNDNKKIENKLFYFDHIDDDICIEIANNNYFWVGLTEIRLNNKFSIRSIGHWLTT